LASDTAEFHRALTSLIRVYQFRDRDRICCHDLSVTQWYALDALVSGGPFTLNELAGELYLEKSTMSRVVDGLENKGYVARNRHPDDGRAVLLEVNPEGLEIHRTIEEDILVGEERLLAGFDPEVRHAMVEFLHRLSDAAASRVEVGGGACCSLGPDTAIP
jgi:DNA-binding MarR family transcriptional regulator